MEFQDQDPPHVCEIKEKVAKFCEDPVKIVDILGTVLGAADAMAAYWTDGFTTVNKMSALPYDIKYAILQTAQMMSYMNYIVNEWEPGDGKKEFDHRYFPIFKIAPESLPNFKKKYETLLECLYLNMKKSKE
ncbi:hypothetical protein HC928_02690 [bacterium]|nr:hypothetical protein [bacterium]